MVSKAIWGVTVTVIAALFVAMFAFNYFSGMFAPSPNPTPTPSPTPTMEPTLTPTPSPVVSPTPIPTPTPSPIVTPTPTPTPNPLQMPIDQGDLNWAGYSVASNRSDPKPVVTGVSGSWVVPEVQASQSDRFSAVWVGIGGFFGTTLIQAGTEQDSINGITYYDAWYEMLPSNSVSISTMSVSPGDTITTSINLVDSTLNLWNIEIKDSTTGESFSQNFVYNSGRSSAEWIVERPNVNNRLSTLASFGSVTMSNCTAAVNGQTAALGYFSSTRIFMYNMGGMRLVNTSTFSSDGSSFTVTYLAL